MVDLLIHASLSLLCVCCMCAGTHPLPVFIAAPVLVRSRPVHRGPTAGTSNSAVFFSIHCVGGHPFRKLLSMDIAMLAAVLSNEVNE